MCLTICSSLCDIIEKRLSHDIAFSTNRYPRNDTCMNLLIIATNKIASCIFYIFLIIYLLKVSFTFHFISISFTFQYVSKNFIVYKLQEEFNNNNNFLLKINKLLIKELNISYTICQMLLYFFLLQSTIIFFSMKNKH